MKQTIHLLICSIIFLSFSSPLFAQVPQMFNYQGIARDASGNALSNQKLSIKLSILPAAEALQPEYEETQTVQTNAFGLYTLQIGAGMPVTGQMKYVKWETGNKYISISIDPLGGTNYVAAGTNQLLSVPYAIYADRSGSTASTESDKTRTGTVTSNVGHIAGDVNYLTKFTAFNIIGKSLLFDNGTSIGLGTSTPAAGTKLHLRQTTGNIEHIRMENTNATGFGKFIMYNDNANNYATFTKYGSAFPGGYAGAASQFPFANLLAFGNNMGPFLLANNGNVGLAIVTGGSTKLYLNAQQNTGYLGIGGTFVPAANVHIGNTSAGDTLLITNATTGHLKTDGLEIRNTGNAAIIINKENSTLSLGSNNNTIIQMTAAGNTEFSGDVKIAKLSGSQIRPVFADTNGVLRADTVISFLASTPAGLPAAIPDNSCSALISTTTISGAPLSVVSKNISVAVTIKHTYVGDLEIYLCSPAGDTLELINDLGLGGNNLEHTIFSDFGDSTINPLSANEAPFSKIYKPKGGLFVNACGVAGELTSFSGFGGGAINPNGIWALMIRDDLGADTGQLISWSLSFDANRPDNFHPKWKSGTLSTTSLIYETDKAVGVGTLAPRAKMHVHDGILVSGIRNAGDTVLVSGPGARMFFNSYKAAFRAGDITVANPIWGNEQIGVCSAAMGLNTIASGNYSFAMGATTTADGTCAVAFGNNSKANAFGSMALGLSSISNGYTSLVIGQYNDSLTVTQPGMQITTPLFIVGNGTDNANRNNAMIVRYDGRVGIGTNTPGATLHVNGALRIGSAETFADSGANLLSLNATLAPSGDNAQNLGSAAHRWGTVFAGNGVINTSDARDKTDIAEIQYGLATLKQLKPVHFRWKQNTDAGYKLGFLAQDLKAVIPEVVSDKEFVMTDEKTGEGEWRETKRMGVYYSDIIPVLTKAMQEQQSLIELQQQQIEDLRKRLEAIEKK